MEPRAQAGVYIERPAAPPCPVIVSLSSCCRRFVHLAAQVINTSSQCKYLVAIHNTPPALHSHLCPALRHPSVCRPRRRTAATAALRPSAAFVLGSRAPRTPRIPERRQTCDVRAKQPDSPPCSLLGTSASDASRHILADRLLASTSRTSPAARFTCFLSSCDPLQCPRPPSRVRFLQSALSAAHGAARYSRR